ncbi:MAG: endolytic transglycosylase MltG, partial [Edaphobacter sp.]
MKFFLSLLLLLLLAAGVVAYVVYTPYGPSTETFVDIAPRTGASAIAAQMEKAGIIRSRYGFALLRLQKPGTLKAGEYRFDHPATMPEVYARLIQGDVYT